MRNRIKNPEHNGAPETLYGCHCCWGKPKGSVYKNHLSSLDQLKEYEENQPMNQEEIDCISLLRKHPAGFMVDEKKKYLGYNSDLCDEKTYNAALTLYFNYEWFLLD